MSCDWRKKIALYVDDELAPEARQQVDAHLRECSECTAAVAENLALKKTVRVAAARFSAPPELHAAVHRRLHPQARVSFWWKWGMSAVSLVLLAALGFVLWPRNGSRDPMIAGLVDQHVITLASANPVDVISEDRHTVKPWFQGKLPFSFNLPELGGSVFQLIGGKLIYAQQKPGAQLLYQTGRHKISVFVFKEPGSREKSPVKIRNLSFNCTVWQQNGLQYYMLTDALNEADPLPFMFQDANR